MEKSGPPVETFIRPTTETTEKQQKNHRKTTEKPQKNHENHEKKSRNPLKYRKLAEIYENI